MGTSDYAQWVEPRSDIPSGRSDPSLARSLLTCNCLATLDTCQCDILTKGARDQLTIHFIQLSFLQAKLQAQAKDQVPSQLISNERALYVSLVKDSRKRQDKYIGPYSKAQPQHCQLLQGLTNEPALNDNYDPSSQPRFLIPWK